MKKSLIVILAAAAFPLLAGQDNLLATFSTKGPDCYADGTVVKDGECYALVWTHTNAVFQGITVDGKAVGSQDENRVLCIVPTRWWPTCTPDRARSRFTSWTRARQPTARPAAWMRA